MEEIALLRAQLEAPSAETVRLSAELTAVQCQLKEARAEQLVDSEYVKGLEELLISNTNPNPNTNHDIPVQPITNNNQPSDTKPSEPPVHEQIAFLQQQMAFYKEDAVQSKQKYEQSEQHLLAQLTQAKEQLVQLQEQLGRCAAEHEMRRMEWQTQLTSHQDTMRLLEFKLSSAQQDNETLLHKLSAMNMPVSERVAILTAENQRLCRELEKHRATHNRHTVTATATTNNPTSVKLKQENMELKAALSSAKEQITLLSGMLSANGPVN